MTFTNELPTSPGWFLWRYEDDYQPLLTEVFVGLNESLRAHHVGDTESRDVTEAAGQWCRLVPVGEIEKLLSAADPFVRVTNLQAGLNIRDYAGMATWMPTKWPTMGDCKKLVEAVERAKRVMEGKE